MSDFQEEAQAREESGAELQTVEAQIAALNAQLGSQAIGEQSTGRPHCAPWICQAMTSMQLLGLHSGISVNSVVQAGCIWAHALATTASCISTCDCAFLDLSR